MKSVFDITIDFLKSQGSYIFDLNSNSHFLDLFSMFSSLPLGYNHKIFDESFDQKIQPIAHLRMCNNLFNSREIENFKREFLEVSFHNNLHFCSTGALAVEAAIKCSFEFKKNPSAIILGLKNSFHGINCWGFMTDTEISSVKNRVIHYPRNNWSLHSLDELIEKLEKQPLNVSAVIIEPIQCTSGDIYLDTIKLKRIQELCNICEICFIVDEIQTGFGVTGEMWYSKTIGLNPDIIIFGKKSQISGIMTNEKYSEAINSKYRKLEVTWDGDLIDAIRSEFILKAIKKYSLLENVREKSDILRDELSSKFDNYRSTGHLIAFDFKSKAKRDDFVNQAFSNFLLVNPTSDKSIRLRPNLAFSNNELDVLLEKINKVRE